MKARWKILVALPIAGFVAACAERAPTVAVSGGEGLREINLTGCKDGGLDGTLTVIGLERIEGGGPVLASVRVEVTKPDADLTKTLGRPVAVESITAHHEKHPYHDYIDGSVVNIRLKDGSLIGLSQESFFPYYWNGVHVNLPSENQPAGIRTFAASSQGMMVEDSNEGCRMRVDVTKRYAAQVVNEPDLNAMNRNPKILNWSKEL